MKCTLDNRKALALFSELAIGASMADAAAIAGVSRPTAFRWLRVGKRHLADGQTTAYSELALGVESARFVERETRDARKRMLRRAEAAEQVAA